MVKYKQGGAMIEWWQTIIKHSAFVGVLDCVLGSCLFSNATESTEPVRWGQMMLIYYPEVGCAFHPGFIFHKGSSYCYWKIPVGEVTNILYYIMRAQTIYNNHILQIKTWPWTNDADTSLVQRNISGNRWLIVWKLWRKLFQPRSV